jgi:arylsulfate sulfotransferase
MNSISHRDTRFTLNKTHLKYNNNTSSSAHRIAIILFITGIATSTHVWPIEITSEPTLTMDPNGVTPLAGAIQFSTDVSTRATVTISNGTDSWVKEFADYNTDHYHPILGLKPNNTYTIKITVTDEVNDSLDLAPDLQAVTDPLPVDFPLISLIHSEPSRMEPGYTLMDKLQRDIGNTPGGDKEKYSIIINNMGEVVWYSTLGTRDMMQSENGNLIYREGHEMYEIDLLGNVQNHLHFSSGTCCHHDLFQTKDGTFLSLGTEPVVVDTFPTSYTDPNAIQQNVTIEDNPIEEFSSDGQLLNKWHLTDLLDTNRIGYLSLKLSIHNIFDWAHANAVVYDNRDDSIIVSVRHQDTVVKFSRSTGELKWILANHDNWSPELQPYLLTPVGPLKWQYHQHSSKVLPSGNILLFDNGNYRATPFDGKEPLQVTESYSRAVEYEIDENAMEIRQVWEYGDLTTDEHFYSQAVSDADLMTTTGNILITAGQTMFVGGMSSNRLGMGGLHTRIIEVDHNTPADKVFEVAVYDTIPDSITAVYRSERIPDLYPLDTDKDGTPDYMDNCKYAANGPLIPDAGGNIQLDSDSDGFGNICDADLNNDNLTNSMDLGLLKLNFFTNNSQSDFDQAADLNGDGIINSNDLGIFKTLFYQSSAPLP